MILSTLLLSLAIATEPSGPVAPIHSARRDAPVVNVSRQPALYSAGTPASTFAQIAPASDADVASLQAWNDSGQVPARNGVYRPLPEPIRVTSGLQALSTEPWRWSGSISVENAARVRLLLTDVTLPAGAILWIYSSIDAPVAFDTTTLVDGQLWTPSVSGPGATIEVESHGGSFSIAGAMELLPPFRLTASTYCLDDAACYPAQTGDSGKAVAYMVYVSGFQSYICTGGLLNDRAGSFTPYFLTANHCISNTAEAASLETYWDYRRTSCNGITPSLSTLPHTLGAVLLTTSPSTDVTLLRLPSAPGSRLFQGWTGQTLSSGTELRRISHPLGLPQSYSTSRVDNALGTCSTKGRPEYLYSSMATGGTAGGSSGSMSFIAEGVDDTYAVGQLFGLCGSDPTANCSVGNSQVDGAFRSSWAVLQPFIDPTPSSCSACVPGQNTACLLGNRFKVTMNWRDYSANLNGAGSVIKYADNKPEIHPTYGPLSESAFFSMYSWAPNSIETLVRMIKGATINDKYWVFLTGFAGAEYTVSVQDTQTCRIWTRTVNSGATNMTKDFEAFPFP